MDRTDSYSKHLLEGYEDGLFLLEAQNLDLLHRIENEAETYQNPQNNEVYQNAEHAYAKARYIDSLIAEFQFNRENGGLISIIDSELVSFQQYHKPVFGEAPTFGSIPGINLDEFPVKLNLSNLEHVEKKLVRNESHAVQESSSTGSTTYPDLLLPKNLRSLLWIRLFHAGDCI